MQGIPAFIPTDLKIRYLNQLLKVGFHTLDFGSFVSPRAVPQMADTEAVLAGLDLSEAATRLLAIVANLRGAQKALGFSAITYLGYPFSLSETFQQRNTKRSMEESVELVQEIHALCEAQGKTLVVYLSMAFGNPYGDPWEEAEVLSWAETFARMGIRILSLADTTGQADPASARRLFAQLIPAFPQVTFGAHFHARPAQRRPMIEAAYAAGCRRFDTAMLGYGGCPFAKDELVGNIATESLLSFVEEKGLSLSLDKEALAKVRTIASEIFQ